MDSSVSPTHGEQENSVWNGHYACTCYHPLFVFNQFGDLERCALRPGNVHSADGWDEVLKPVMSRYRGKVSRIYFRADAGLEQAARALAAPEPWIAHSRAAPNSGTSWQSYPGSVRKPAPPHAGSSLRRRQTVEPLRKSPQRTSPATPLRIRLRKGSASKVAGFYSATRDRVMPPLRGLLLLRRVHILELASRITVC